MVFTGSVGLHHVLAVLRESGYRGTPTNDMFTRDVPALVQPDAAELARRLLEGDRIACDDAPEMARAIGSQVDGIPFYVHHVVARLRSRGGNVTPAVVEEVVQSLLTDAQDPLDLGHFVRRVGDYYKSRSSLALALLDASAHADESLPFQALLDAARAATRDAELETVRDLVGLLQRDHYLEQEPDGDYRFRFSLIQRFWRLNRG